MYFLNPFILYSLLLSPLQHQGSRQVSLPSPGGALQEAAAAPRAAAAGLPEGVDQFSRV